jgi:hypothetical protein
VGKYKGNNQRNNDTEIPIQSNGPRTCWNSGGAFFLEVTDLLALGAISIGSTGGTALEVFLH